MTHGISCHGEPLSMWCAPCRLTRLLSELHRDFAAAQIALARVADPRTGPGRVVDELSIVGAHLKMAKTELASAIELAGEIERSPA